MEQLSADRVFIGLGTNLGDREANLRSAVAHLSQIFGVQVHAVSSVYETAPIGPHQPRYLNAVAEVSCTLTPVELLQALKQLEKQMGRTESSERWGPRLVDLDILLWGARVVNEPDLKVPHAQLHHRRFALEPLCELFPDAVHPGLGRPLKGLLAQLQDQDVTRRV